MTSAIYPKSESLGVSNGNQKNDDLSITIKEEKSTNSSRQKKEKSFI